MKWINKILIASLCLSTLMVAGCSENGVYLMTREEKGEQAQATIVPPKDITIPNVSGTSGNLDSQKPKIFVKRDYSSGINASKYILLPDVIATDNADSSPFLTVTAIDPNGEKVQFTKDGRFFVPTLGTYTFYYNCIDAAGNIADELVLPIEVKDETAPVVNLRGMDTVGGYTHTKIKIPSVLLSDYHDCDLEIKIGKHGTDISEWDTVDEHSLMYRPAESGVYDVQYIATEKRDSALQTVATITMNVEDLTTINNCEGNGLYVWSFGGEMSVDPKPSIVEDKTVKTEGTASMKVTIAGSESQMQYGADASGFVTGTSMYSDFGYCGTTDISGYQYVKIDVYNANAEETQVRLWVHDNTNTSCIGEAQTVKPGEWITLVFTVEELREKGLNVEKMTSVLVTFKGYADGMRIYNVDNFRVE